MSQGPAETSLTRAQGSVLVLLVGAVLSFGGLAFRLTDDVDPWEYLVARGAGLLGVVVAIFGWRAVRQVTPGLGDVARSVRAIHLVIGLVLCSTNVLFIVLLDVTTVAFVLFTQSLGPLAAAWFSWWLYRERVSAKTLIATGASVLGVLVMVAGTVTDDVSPWALLTLVLPMAFGLYTSLYRGAGDVSPYVPVMVTGVCLVLGGAAVVLATGGFDLSLRDAAIGFFAGSVLLGVPIVGLNLALRVVPGPMAALLIMTEVVLAPVWVWVFVDERPEPTTVLGGAIILAAVVWLTAAQVRSAQVRAAQVRSVSQPG